jgi:hypothetical protein
VNPVSFVSHVPAATSSGPAYASVRTRKIVVIALHFYAAAE